MHGKKGLRLTLFHKKTKDDTMDDTIKKEHIVMKFKKVVPQNNITVSLKIDTSTPV